MLVASLLILVRPEGFFIGVLWAAWILRNADWGLQTAAGSRQLLKSASWFSQNLIRNPQSAIRILLLASGMFIWWLAAYLLTGDKLWIIHNWPPDWQVDGKANGTGPIWWYAALLPLIVGVPLIVPFLVGLWGLVKRREFVVGTSSFLTLFILHSLMFSRGWFGSAGYARYFVCVSPAIALIALAGWNQLAERQQWLFNLAKPAVATATLLLAALACTVYVDGNRFTRDARAVEVMNSWLHAKHPQLVAESVQLISSQAYPRILLDRDPWEKLSFTSDPGKNLELIRKSPEGTLVLWDEETGPKWYGLWAADFEAAGYQRLMSQDFNMRGWFVRLGWRHVGGPRIQRMHWLYKTPIGQQPSVSNSGRAIEQPTAN